jgi:hypothetical protein
MTGRLDLRRPLYEAILCVSIEWRRIERVEVNSAMHEPNSGHSGEVKQARPSFRREQAQRVGTISDHIVSPSGSKQHERSMPRYVGIGRWFDRPVPAGGRCHRSDGRPVMRITISGRFRTIQDD